jgi:prevent-host-death family protein
MKGTASVAQLKARLSEYLRQVKGGSELVITERGIPVARLSPLDAERRRSTRAERLARAGLLRRGAGKLRKSLLTPPAGDPQLGRDVLEALLAERGER